MGGTMGRKEEERYIIYNVSKEEYDSCRISQADPRVVAVCDKPDKELQFTITFRSFSPRPRVKPETDEGTGLSREEGVRQISRVSSFQTGLVQPKPRERQQSSVIKQEASTMSSSTSVSPPAAVVLLVLASGLVRLTWM